MEKKGLHKYFDSNSASSQGIDTPSTSNTFGESESCEISNAQNKNVSNSNAPTTSKSSECVARATSESGSEVESEIDSKIKKKQQQKRKKKNAVRKYDAQYLAFGFISIEKDGKPCPHCLICHKNLANSSMVPVKMLRHLQNLHAELANKPIEYFKDLKSEQKNQSKSMESYANSELKAIQSSFAVAYEIAKAKKPFTLAEKVIQPCLKQVVNILFGESSGEKLNSVPLSRQTIGRRVSEMARDVKNQLVARLKKSVYFTLQFDESTDVANEAILVGFVRYAHEEKILEDIFCFYSLPDRTTGERIFQAIEQKINEYQLDFKNVIGLCTDGAPAMLGVNVGLAKRMSDVGNENFESSHCILHREALASKKMSPILNETLSLSVKIINNIRANPLNSRIFALICEELGSEHDVLLLHADVRWLSRGKTLSRLLELRKEICKYFEQYSREYKEKMSKRKKKNDAPPPKLHEEEYLEKLIDVNWLSTLTYLVDVFSYLNELNLKSQGREMNVFVFWNRIEGFKKKLVNWKSEVKANNFESFSSTNDLLLENKSCLKYIQPIVCDHLEELISHFEKQFPVDRDPRKFYLWVVNPFVNEKEPNSLKPAEKYLLLGNSHADFFHFLLF